MIFPDYSVRPLLRGGADRVLAAPALSETLEAIHAGRQLLLLRVLGLALPCLLAFTTVVDHTIGGADPPSERPEDPQTIADRRAGRQPEGGRLFQVLRLLRQFAHQPLPPVSGSSLPIPILDIILPVGISFFTFQSLSYTIDIYRRKLEPVPLLDFAVFVSFFPHLVAGPIVRERRVPSSAAREA